MKLHLAFAAVPAQLAWASDTMERALRARQVDSDCIGRARLVVEELASNVIAHGRQLPKQALLRLCVQVQAERVWLELRDPAPPFDPRQGAAPLLDAPVEERPIGGLGLYMVEHSVNHISYHRDGAYNIVQVVLLRAPSPADTRSR